MSQPRSNLQLAEWYLSLGFLLIPTKPGTKKPAIAHWKIYQSRQPALDEIREWFEAHSERGIGLILGDVSGGWVVRDFDKRAAYKAWQAANPDLAATLPTVKTARGFHVYFIAPGTKTARLADGELRSTGSYVLAPPSVHPDTGEPYEWFNPLDPSKGKIDAALVVRLNQEWHSEAHAGSQDEEIDTHRHIQIDLDKAPCLTYVDAAISRTQPTGPGERNAAIFRLVLLLKRNPEFASLPAKRFKSAMREWHRRALAVIRTKCFDESWGDFTIAWERVTAYPGGVSLETVRDAALDRDLPAIAADYDTSEFRQTIAICRELQSLAGEKPFFLSAHSLADLLDVAPTTAWRWLRTLESDGVLKLVKRGNKKRATRYCYLGGD